MPPTHPEAFPMNRGGGREFLIPTSSFLIHGNGTHFLPSHLAPLRPSRAGYRVGIPFLERRSKTSACGWPWVLPAAAGINATEGANASRRAAEVEPRLP